MPTSPHTFTTHATRYGLFDRSCSRTGTGRPLKEVADRGPYIPYRYISVQSFRVRVHTRRKNKRAHAYAAARGAAGRGGRQKPTLLRHRCGVRDCGSHPSYKALAVRRGTGSATVRWSRHSRKPFCSMHAANSRRNRAIFSRNTEHALLPVTVLHRLGLGRDLERPLETTRHQPLRSLPHAMPQLA